jgi:UDP-galactopyranose mutase
MNTPAVEARTGYLKALKMHVDRKVLVVGAGFAGAVYARVLAEAGCGVTVIDQRDHIAGNAYDLIDPTTGVRFHKYGPHLFHTNQAHVVEWLSRFTEWTNYDHRVRAQLPNGRFVPLPVNIDTINAIFSQSLAAETEARDFLDSISKPIKSPRNAGEYLEASIGPELTELFFARYTKKMWAMGLHEIDASVVKRLPIRFDKENRYFPNDAYQMLPAHGYTRIFKNLLNHVNIETMLSTEFTRSMEKEYYWTFNSMAIDAYFKEELGPLPYRSIRFHHETRENSGEREWSVTNFTDEGPITRETEWHRLPNHAPEDLRYILVTREEPCDYRDNNLERYYPVKTADGRYFERYKRYRDLAEARANINFIGRCGTYQYLNMDQVINQSLTGARKWLESQQQAVAT